MTSWWRHHMGHGSLISGENGPFLVWKRDNLIVSHLIVTKLNMNDDMGSVTNPIWWRQDDVITRVTAHWFPAKTAHFWSESLITWSFLIRSLPNSRWMMTLGQWQTPFDDVIIRVTAYWFLAKTAHFESVITWSFLILTSSNLIWMITWGQWPTPFDDVITDVLVFSLFAVILNIYIFNEQMSVIWKDQK